MCGYCIMCSVITLFCILLFDLQYTLFDIFSPLFEHSADVFEFLDNIRIRFHVAFHFFAGVDDRSVVFASKFLTYERIRDIEVFTEYVHS